MKKKTKIDWREIIANVFGMFGYFNVVLQWLFLLIFSLPLIQSLHFAPSKPPETPVIILVQPEVPHDPSILTYIFSACIVIAMIGLSLYVLLRIPISIVRSSHRIVDEGAEAITPIVVRAVHTKNPKKSARNIKPYISLALKLFMSLTPLALLYILHAQLDFNGISTFTVYLIGGILAGISFILFGLQYLIARLGAIRIDRLL